MKLNHGRIACFETHKSSRGSNDVKKNHPQSVFGHFICATYDFIVRLYFIFDVICTHKCPNIKCQANTV